MRQTGNLGLYAFRDGAQWTPKPTDPSRLLALAWGRKADGQKVVKSVEVAADASDEEKASSARAASRIIDEHLR